MPSILITGASDGIGRALVEHYASEGWDIIATGRRSEADISSPLPDGCTYVSLDLTEDLDTVLAACPDALDAAILNAGAGKVAPPAAHAASDIAQMVAINTTAPLLLAQALFPRLQGGTLAFIGSTAAKGAQTDFAIYAATKAALAGAHRSLALEWDGKVKTLMIHPGPTATGMHDKAGLRDVAIRRVFTPPDVVARAIAEAVKAGRSRSLGLGFTLRHALKGGRS